MPRIALTRHETEKFAVDEYGFYLSPGTPFSEIENLTRMERNEKTLITTGSWVLITQTIPCKNAPQVYGIYWAVPYRRNGRAGVKDPKTGLYTGKEVTKELIGVDEYGRQCATVFTPSEVRIFPDEYTILSEEKVQIYRELGYVLHQTGAPMDINRKLNMKLIQKGRSLTEEEREVIWALQLDGLTESQACEEYFLTHHTAETENTAICYLPSAEALKDIMAVFGPR